MQIGFLKNEVVLFKKIKSTENLHVRISSNSFQFNNPISANKMESRTVAFMSRIINPTNFPNQLLYEVVFAAQRTRCCTKFFKFFSGFVETKASYNFN